MNEMNLLTIIILAILVFCALFGMKAGLIKTVFSMFSMILALILTVVFSPMVSNGLQNNEKISNYFYEKTDEALKLEEKTIKTSEQEAFIENLPIPASFKGKMQENNKLDIYEILNVNSFTEYITRSVANVMINAVAFIGTFLVILIILKILCGLLDVVSKLPVLNSLNKAGGLIAGILHGLIIVWVFCIVITALGGTEFGKNAFISINESQILSFIYDNNMITRYLANIKVK